MFFSLCDIYHCTVRGVEKLNFNGEGMCCNKLFSFPLLLFLGLYYVVCVCIFKIQKSNHYIVVRRHMNVEALWFVTDIICDVQVFHSFDYEQSVILKNHYHQISRWKIKI